MSNQSPFRAFWSPAQFAITACESLMEHPDVYDVVKRQAEDCLVVANAALDTVESVMKSPTGAATVERKMEKHIHEFNALCMKNDLYQMVDKENFNLAPILFAKLMTANLCVDHYAWKQKVRRYPVWREFLTKTAALLDMMIPTLGAHEQNAYKVAEYMVAVVAPTDKRKAKKEARLAA